MNRNDEEERSHLWGPYLIGLGLCMAVVIAISVNINLEFAQVAMMVIFTVALLVSGVYVWYADRTDMEDASQNRSF